MHLTHYAYEIAQQLTCSISISVSGLLASRQILRMIFLRAPCVTFYTRTHTYTHTQTHTHKHTHTHTHM